MAVMRVEKNSNYTVMSNYHLRDNRISLKAKGLLSVMLSLPSEWDFTIVGLTHISKEGISTIRAAIHELEKNGYVTRTRLRNAAGQLADIEYTIYEFPQESSSNLHDDPIDPDPSEPEPIAKPIKANRPVAILPHEPSGSDSHAFKKPISENLTLDNLTLDSLTLENRMQLNKDRLNTDLRKKDQRNTDLSYPYQSLTESVSHELCPQQLRDRIKDQIGYRDLMDEYDPDEIDNIVSVMEEILSARCESFTISGKKYPALLVRERFRQISYTHIEYVLQCMHQCTSNIRNIKQYLIVTLFNAPATCSSYYSAAVRHGLALG